jgi:hypothetical protein
LSIRDPKVGNYWMEQSSGNRQQQMVMDRVLDRVPRSRPYRCVTCMDLVDNVGVEIFLTCIMEDQKWI